MKPYVLIFTVLISIVHFSHSQTTVGLIQHEEETLDDGYILFAPNGRSETYLINTCGNLVHSWPSDYRPGQSCYILDDGNLLRTGRINSTSFNGGGKGGIIEKIDWAGNVVWSYTISDATKCQHHDVKILPNGNVLVIAWEAKSNTDAIALGRNPSLTSQTVWSEQILEIEPVGTNGGNVVWEWHLWDHLIQDFDDTKANYGTIDTNPHLLNINYRARSNVEDWIHLNSIDYNEELDQILLSTHNLNEIWIIDHSTTTEEAASHEGGNSGKGGDFLYRWGNPDAYKVVGEEILFGQHNARWIEKGYPYENQIMIFNNGNGRPGGNYSTIEIIAPPTDGFNYISTLPYLPELQSWTYNYGNPNNVYATNISGAQQLANGNVLYCLGPQGVFAQINSEGETLWKYISPASNFGIINQGNNPIQNSAFRCTFYPEDYSGFENQILTPGSTIENLNLETEECNLVLDADDLDLSESIKIYPNPSSDYLTISHEGVDLKKIIIYNAFGQLVYENEGQNVTNRSTIPLDQFTNGMYFLGVEIEGSKKSFKVVIEK